MPEEEEEGGSYPHYICTGDCKGVSDGPGICTTTGCSRFNEHLEECNCEDDQHGGMAEEGPKPMM